MIRKEGKKIVFIQTEETPNPDVLKFLPGTIVMPKGTASFSQPEACQSSPFAKKLLESEGITSVFFGEDFISITKKTEEDWYLLKPRILGLIMEQFLSKLPVIILDIETISADKDSEDPLWTQIRELIDTRVRPAVAQDGGDIIFQSFEDGIVYLKLYGACEGCPSSSATLKSGIENMLKYYVPEILEVRAVN